MLHRVFEDQKKQGVLMAEVLVSGVLLVPRVSGVVGRLRVPLSGVLGVLGVLGVSVSRVLEVS